MHTSFYSLSPPLMALRMHKIPKGQRDGTLNHEVREGTEHPGQEPSGAFSSSLTVAQHFLAPKVKRTPQGSYMNDTSRQREMDQEQLRVTLSGNQRALSGALQEGVLREQCDPTLPSEGHVPQACPQKQLALLQWSPPL